jgi:hypothetical protein
VVNPREPVRESVKFAVLDDRWLCNQIRVRSAFKFLALLFLKTGGQVGLANKSDIPEEPPRVVTGGLSRCAA